MDQPEEKRRKKQNQKKRKPHQRKRALKGTKSMRDKPEYYDDLKGRVTISITPTAKDGFDALSSAREVSRSEFIERIGRQLIKLADDAMEQQ